MDTVLLFVCGVMSVDIVLSSRGKRSSLSDILFEEPKGFPNLKATATGLGVAVFVIMVVVTFFCCCACCYQEYLKKRYGSTTGQEDTTNQQTSSAPPTARTTTAATTTSGAQPSPQQPATFSTEILTKVQIPHRIAEDEEMALYTQDRKWLEEVAREGATQWQLRTMTEDRLNIQKRKNQLRFLCVYSKRLGRTHRCNGCREKVDNKGEWYRCRTCLDTDFCASCFSRGPSVSAYGHVPSHECFNIVVQEMCFNCKAFIINTKYSCSDCYHVHYCLGCYKTGKHEEAHGDHRFEQIMATSYVMMKPEDVTKETETSPLLPPGYSPQVVPPSAPPGGACNVPMLPPSYGRGYGSQPPESREGGGAEGGASCTITPQAPEEPPPSYEEVEAEELFKRPPSPS